MYYVAKIKGADKLGRYSAADLCRMQKADFLVTQLTLSSGEGFVETGCAV